MAWPDKADMAREPMGVIRIADAVQDSIVDGPGLRYTVFVQGCSRRCPGCQNPQTHDPCGGRAAAVDALIRELACNPLTDGLSLSGGEPMEQAAACLKLAEAAHAGGLDVWCWTGETLEDLLDRGTAEQLALLHETDVLVDGPFLLAQRTLDLPWRGSRNQRILDLKASFAQGRAVLLDA